MLTQKTAETRARKPLLPADRPQPTDPIPFDRRRHGRNPSEGSVMASFISDETGITLVRVELKDSSREGAGLRCPLQIEPGTRFSLYRDGLALSSDRGVVARCTCVEDHYILGLRFEERSGAAA
jgi:hypothetical protein